MYRARTIQLSFALGAWLLSTAHAFSDVYFNTNATLGCPGMDFACIAPSVCARDELRDKYYCCPPGDPNTACWGASVDCTGDSSTQTCNSGGGFCCLSGAEICTQRADADPIANVSVEVMNNTYSSLSSANAGATTILFNLASFLSTSAATTQSTASTIIPSTSASVSATSTSSQTSSTGSATSTGTYTSSSSSSPASTDTPAGLSQSAKVGIGAGVGVGAVAILACVGM
ncbi:hypothetical protein LTR95_008266 [Oleoguttula sp. CCFEE 5521]